MSLLSKSEIQFLQGQKQVSKSYKYKLKSVIKKKLFTLLEKELPLLSKLFPTYDLTAINSKLNNEKQINLTKYSKIPYKTSLDNLTKISKKRVDSHYNIQSKIGYDEIKPTKLVACEGLEGSKHAYNDHKQQKATENSNYKKEKINQRRERDLNLWF